MTFEILLYRDLMVTCQCFLKAKFSPVEGLAGTAGLATALFPDLCCGSDLRQGELDKGGSSVTS